MIRRSVEIGCYKTTVEAAAGALLLGVLTAAIAMLFLRSRQPDPSEYDGNHQV